MRKSVIVELSFILVTAASMCLLAFLIMVALKAAGVPL